MPTEHLTIAYITSRKDCCFDWFLDSLLLQTSEVCKGIKLVVVDFHNVGRTEWKLRLSDLGTNWAWTEPKPNVWQGSDRLTKDNWFAASNARNTALCLAPDGWIAYVDDLSVLKPGWLQCVREAMAGNYIVCGAYQKVKNLFVQKGEIKSFEEFPGGIDNRLKHVSEDVTTCAGNWLFGCSLAGPVETFLSVNGWPEDLCDGMGSEDYCMGLVLSNAGYTMKYDRRMMTYESEEMHYAEPALKREDWHFENNIAVKGGNGELDKSHSALNIALQSKLFPNSFGEGGIRGLRETVLQGRPFPVKAVPDREWFTGRLLSEIA